MPPRVVPESSVRVFKFWFGNNLRDGLNYAHELYFLSQTRSAQERAYLYKQAHELAFQGADVLVTVGQSHCSLWVSLRNQTLAAKDLQHHAQTALPPAESTHLLRDSLPG